jgi:cytochrome b561
VVDGRPGGADHLDVDAAAERMRAFVPAPPAHDGPPPATVTAAPITHRAHGWTVVGLIVLGVVATMAAAQL